MAKQVPAYIENELRLLEKALASVVKHAEKLSEYVDKNADGLGDDYFNEARLDMPYEFDIDYARDLIDEYLSEQ